jgi:ubiquinone/menaquinone biosynthesis C-methylase UbiE
MTGEERSFEESVAQHYTHGWLERAVLEALQASGKDPDHLVPADLAPVDEFHIGGRQATLDLAAQLDVAPGGHLLDLGCGLGGASRLFAHERGCTVTGIDLTEEYVRTARGLSARVGLDRRVAFYTGSVLALPFEPRTFDGAYMLHVGMNIRDKAALFAEVRRVLEPGAVFGVYDVMRENGDGPLSFPMPWATSADTSFVESADTYRSLLERAGFEVRTCRSRRTFAIEFFQRMRAQVAQSGGPPPLGLHVLMGAEAPQKIANMIDNLERGLIAPTEIVATA